MDWEMLIVTGALLGMLMLFAILSMIWREKSLHASEAADKNSRKLTSKSIEFEKVTGQENSSA